MGVIMGWSTAELADMILEGLQQRAQEDDVEQAVYGFDCLDELGLHPLIHQALRAGGYGVWPEQRYPGDWNKRRLSEGKRCDVVVTPSSRPLRNPEVKDTLFDTSDAIDANQAFWLEIKTVAQFEQSGPFRRYSAELLSPVTEDVKKLWSDEGIGYAGLGLILFTADEEIAKHDLAAWHQRCLERGVGVGVPAIRGFKITERVGNGYCSVAVFGVRGM